MYFTLEMLNIILHNFGLVTSSELTFFLIISVVCCSLEMQCTLKGKREMLLKCSAFINLKLNWARGEREQGNETFC